MGAPSAPYSIVVGHLNAGRVPQAIAALRVLLRRSPGDDHAQFLLGNAHAQVMEFEQAAHYLRSAAAARPADPSRWAALVQTLHRAGKWEEAISLGRETILLGVVSAPLLTATGDALVEAACAAEARELYGRALALEPRFPNVHKSLARLHSLAGEHDECVEHMRRAVSLNPQSPQARSSLCFHMNYSPNLSREEVFAEHVALGRLIGAAGPRGPIESGRGSAVVAAAGGSTRRLKIAYISHDIRQHSVAYFIGPLLRHHDRERFHVTLVSTTVKRDNVTERLGGLADRFLEAASQDAATFIDAMKKERFDILIDLNGLTGGERVYSFVARLAPLQMTYLGYPNTTGVPGVDCRIVDGITDPEGPLPGESEAADEFCTEKLLRMPECFMCYQPHEGAPDVAPLPAEFVNGNGPIVFGSFNKSDKISIRTVDVWSRVLLGVPGSRLLLKAAAMEDPWIQERFLASFAACGIGSERIEFAARTSSVDEHLARYGDVHVALDTFPYNGATTTCEALWMGVPVVTLAGVTHASRVGASLLRAAGLRELVAESADDFVRIAVDLARDRVRVRALRASMRKRMAASVLCDGAGFARRLEEVVSGEWKR